MTYLLADKLVVGISTRALFDLSEASRIYELRGLRAFRAFQLEKEDEPLPPGTAFPLIRGLLAINTLLPEKIIEVVVISRNHPEAGMRVFNSIEHYGLGIGRGIFTGGRSPWPYLSALNCSLFLSAERQAVVEAIRASVPAALVLEPPMRQAGEHGPEVRIAFDGDAVLFGDESDRLYEAEGLDVFQRYEADHALEPLKPGPFEPFLRALKLVQGHFPEGESPIRIAIVTARNAPAHKRVMTTLRSWQVAVDEMFLLGGIQKAGVLRVFGPDIFFDDQLANLEPAQEVVPSAHVVQAADQLEAFADIPTLTAPIGPLVLFPPARAAGAQPTFTSVGRDETTVQLTGAGKNSDPDPAIDGGAGHPERDRSSLGA